MNTPIKVGILGTGRIAVDGHVKAIREAGGVVSALADIVPGRAAKYAKMLNVPHWYETTRDLLDSGEIGVVDICTPPVTHLAEVTAALGAGYSVYLEKPPAMNQAEMSTMADMANEKGLFLMTGTNHVFHPSTQFVKGLLDRGEMGDIYAVELHKTIRRFYRKGWHRSKAVAGGGVVMDSSTHRMDLALYLLSNPEIVSVSATTFSHFAGLEEPAGNRQAYLVMDVAEQSGSKQSAPVDIEDSVMARIRLESGSVITLREMVGVNMPDETVIKIYGTKAGAVLRFSGPGAGTVSIYGEAADGTLSDNSPVVSAGRKAEMAHTGAFRHFFEVVSEDRTEPAGLERAVNLMGLVDAIYRSSSQGGREVLLK